MKTNENEHENFLESNYIKRFAVVSLWPGIQTGEREVIARLKVAAEMLGLECVEIDSNGFCTETGKEITAKEADFAIHLHFETPKNYDIFSFVALWNPLQFYFDFGYKKHVKHLVSHDDFLSCLSPGADDHIKRLLIRQPLHLPPKFTLFHSLASPVIEPVVQQRKLFYVGINWEKIGGGKSRHEGLLKKLDGTGYLRIYGPRIFQGVKVWKGFNSYVKELPFDGVSVIEEIHSCGAGLVLSSKAHIEAGLMSNRLFETVAAGAVAICDDNPFARKHFGDALLYVSYDKGDLFTQIDEHMAWMNANLSEAQALAMRAQKIFKEKFLLTHSLRSIYQGLIERKKSLSLNQSNSLINGPKVVLVCVLIDERDSSVNQLIAACITQDYHNLSIVIGVDETCSKTGTIQQELTKAKVKHRIIKLNNLSSDCLKRMGTVISSLLKTIRSEDFDNFIIYLSHEEMFHNHISSLVGLSEAQQSHSIVATAAVLTHTYKGKIVTRLQDSVVLNTSVYANPIGFARFMFPKSVIKDSLFCFLPYLDKRCFAALVGEREVIGSSLVTARINCDSPIFSQRMTDLVEIATIHDVYPNHPAYKWTRSRQRAFNIPINIALKKMKYHVRKLPMPLFVRRRLRVIYRRLKTLSSV